MMPVNHTSHLVLGGIICVLGVVVLVLLWWIQQQDAEIEALKRRELPREGA